MNTLLGLAFIVGVGIAGTQDKKDVKNYKDEILEMRQKRRVEREDVSRRLKKKGKDLRGVNYYLHLKKGTREQRVRNI
jgi:hypothetical protein